MKRKIESTSEIKVSRPERKNIHEDLNLKAVCVISHSNEINSPFSLSSNDECIVLRNKHEMELLNFDKILGDHQTKFQIDITKHKISHYEVSANLNLNEKRIYNSSNHHEKSEIMLNPMLMPRCCLKNIQLLKCLPSPASKNHKPFISSLSSHGSLEITRHQVDEDTNQTKIQFVAELCEIRKSSFSLPTNCYRLNKMKELFNELTFSNFDWCPIFIGTTRHLAAVTKMNEIIIYAITLDGEVKVQCSEKLDEIVSELKWIVIPDGHFLIVANSKGQLSRYLIEMTDGENVSELMKISDIEGKLKIPVSQIYAEQVGSAILLVCAKVHSLEIFVINKSIVKSITKYVGICITGIVSVSNSSPEFLVSTSSKINFMKLSINKSDVKIEHWQEVDTISNYDPHKFGIYGITASRNKALVFVSMYPQAMYDHLVLKQPNLITVNLYSKNSPYDILLENKSLLLTDFFDCVEAVRYIGTLRIDSLKKLESWEINAELSRKFLYYLKIQMIVTNAKLVYYKSRSDDKIAALEATKVWQKKTIGVVNGYFLIESILTRKEEKLSEAAKQSICCWRKTIRNFLDEDIKIETFSSTQKLLKEKLESILDKCKAFEDKELCLYCNGSIEKDKLICKDNHQASRCSITKLQIPLSVKHICSHCNCDFTDLETVKDITEKEEQFCPFCDRFIQFE